MVLLEPEVEAMEEVEEEEDAADEEEVELYPESEVPSLSRSP